MMGRPTADADQASYDILDCVHIMWACNKLLCSSGKIRATKTYDWPTTCGLVIFCAASLNLYSEVHVPITVSF